MIQTITMRFFLFVTLVCTHILYNFGYEHYSKRLPDDILYIKLYIELFVQKSQLILLFRLIVYVLMYFCAKCLLKVIFLFPPIWKIVVMRKTRDCIFL